jgi:hypothetical protein
VRETDKEKRARLAASRESLLRASADAMSGISEALSEAAEVRRSLTARELGEAVDRLLDSAAQDARRGTSPYDQGLWAGAGGHGGANETAWALSVQYLLPPGLDGAPTPAVRSFVRGMLERDAAVQRTCRGKCDDHEAPEASGPRGQWYDCEQATAPRDDMSLTGYTPMSQGRGVEDTIWNRDVLEDPPDGADAEYVVYMDELRGGGAPCDCPTCRGDRGLAPLAEQEIQADYTEADAAVTYETYVTYVTYGEPALGRTFPAGAVAEAVSEDLRNERSRELWMRAREAAFGWGAQDARRLTPGEVERLNESFERSAETARELLDMILGGLRAMHETDDEAGELTDD